MPDIANKDKISIVVPIYNSENYLLRCIHSIQNQSYKNLEVLLVDDGSRDHSLEICQREAKKDSRIRVIHQENLGVAGARNTGIREMSGEWLMLIDADDYIHVDMAKDLLQAAKVQNAQAAICGFERVFADNSPREVHQLKKGWSGSLHQFSEEMLLLLYRSLLLRTQSNKLYSAEVIKQHQLMYPDKFSINEDIWFCTRYLTFCKRIACIPGSYLYYWQNSVGDSQISRYHPEGVESCFLLLSAMEELLNEAKASVKVRQEIKNEMLFHICGFAGHSYYRVWKSRKECFNEICALAERREMRKLLSQLKPRGIKNQIAAFLLKNKYCRWYHWLCLCLYAKQRKQRKIMENQRKTQKNSDEILVSISCVTYNHAPYVARALDSYLMQKTNFKFEILVYDDASTDQTQDIIRQYEKRYPDIIKPYYQTKNQYSQGKYNVEGFFNYPRAKGKYIAMSDGDDYWTDEKKLQMQVDYMEAHPECAMCLHSARIETQERAVQSMEIRPYKKSRLIPAEEVIDKPFNYPTASLLFRTENTRDLQEYYYVSPVGDIPIQIHMAAKGTVYYMDRKMSVYQQGVSVSWSALMKQGDYKQNLIHHHNAMKVMYRGFSKETGGKYDHAIERACRRMDFLTLINVKEYQEALLPIYRCFYRELDIRTRFFIRFEQIAPRLYKSLRMLVFGKDRV